MTIWINNPFDFLPGEGARLQRYGLLAKALVKAGHRVLWWSSDWNHIKKEEREVLKLGVEGKMRGVDIRLIKTIPYFKNIGIKRLMSHYLYARQWEKKAIEFASEDKKPDLIICSAPPLSTGWVMRKLCKHLGCVGVIDVMDVWPETFERVVPKWMLCPLRWMARRVYEGADGISAVGDSYLKVVKKYLKCANKKPIYRCYHGIEMPGESRDARSLARADGPLRLVYVGNMGKGYDLATLVRGVVEMVDEGHSLCLDLIGKGEQEETLKTLSGARGDIRFHGVITGDKLSELFRKADIGVVPMFPETYVAVPYKLADYASASLPVISSLKGETEDLIKKYNAGWFYEAGDVVSLKCAIQACEEEHRTPCEDLRKNRARQMAEENFDAERIYPEFVAWLEDLVVRKTVEP